MYPSNPSNGPAPTAGYVPYFYQAGLYLRYGSPAHHARSGLEYTSSTLAQLSGSGLSIQPFDRLQTVEDVIQRGYFAVPAGDPVTAMISDRKHTSWFGLDDVISQIRGRHAIYQQNMEDLQEAMCEANNAVHRQVADQGAPADQRQQYSASKMIQELYEQQRAERIELWRDVSRLRLALPESAQLYLTAYRKVSALQAPWGDAP